MCIATNCVRVLFVLLLCASRSHGRLDPGESSQGWPRQAATGSSCNREVCVDEQLDTRIDQLYGAGNTPGRMQGQLTKPYTKDSRIRRDLPLQYLPANRGSIQFPTAKLENLVVSAGKLNPPFSNSSVYDYKVLVPAGASYIRITVVLPKQDQEDYAVKLEGIPLASGTQSPPMVLKDDTELFRITVNALAHHPSVYRVSTFRESGKKPSQHIRTFLLILTGLLLVAVMAFLVYAVFLYVVSGRERGWWPLRYPLRDPTPTDYTPITEV